MQAQSRENSPSECNISRMMAFLRRTRITTLLLLVVVLPALAQTQDVSFHHLTINEGLSQNAVFAILQDQKGFMWFGTKDGLNRYDGYSFTVYQHNSFDSTSLSSSYVTALFEDSRGFIWAGTLDAGLNLFHRDHDRFQRVPLFADSAQSQEPGKIQSIAEDATGALWIATDGDGVFRIQSPHGTAGAMRIRQYVHNPRTPGSLSHTTARALLVDSKGAVWLGTGRGLDRFRPGDDSFDHFHIVTKDPRAPAFDGDNAITAVHESSDGLLWLGTPSGLVRFEQTDGTYTLFPHHNAISRFGWGTITRILEDRTGRLWLCTPGELMRFDVPTLTYDYFRNDPSDNRSIGYNTILSAWQDRTGMLWFGTGGAGIDTYDPNATRFAMLVRQRDATSRVAGFSVRSVLEDLAGDVWMSTDVLYKWTRKTGKWKSFETTSDRPDDFGNTGSWSMIQSPTGEMWFATSQGLFRYSPRTGSTRQYVSDPADSSSLREKEVRTVFEDRSGTIWVMTANYLSKLVNAEEGRFKHVRYRRTPPKEQPRPVLWQDRQGQIWIGTEDGLLRFSPGTGTFVEFRTIPHDKASISNNWVKSICPDPRKPDSVLWIGTAGGGLNRLDRATGHFTHFTDADGLPNNVVYGILPDNRGRLWLSTNKGLSRFDAELGTFRNFDVRDGLQSNEFNTGAYFRSSSGEMFFGGINGLNYFHPDSVKDNIHIPQIVLTGLKLDNREISTRDTNPVLTKHITETTSVTLGPGVNSITFEFAALAFSSPEKNQYSYILEPFNPDWVYAGKNRSVTYTNLPPGEYVFRVKGSNNDGVWNEVGTSLAVTMRPSAWRTWWAYGLYAFLVVALLYSLRRYEMNRLRLKNQLQIEQLDAKNLKKLDQVKSRFFANISHEFRTPLTLILGQIDSVMSSGIDPKEKGKLQVALRNAGRLLNLINQLLDLSKIEAGGMELRAESQNVVSFLKNIASAFESLAQQRAIALTFESEADRILVVFEQDKMEKIFYNLLSNALKFTPRGGKITIRVEVTPPGGDFVQIVVRDSGIGISQREIPHIFDRFYQAGNAGTTVHEGTGIGLALAKELVELHGGSITVTSEEGVGTTFVVRLPKLQATHAGEAPAVSSGAVAVPGVPPDEQEGAAHLPGDASSGEVILIVEDNADVCAYIREQLEDLYTIVEAVNGSDGVAKAQEGIPDLIVTDLMMPGVDGYEFTRLIRGDTKTSHIPVVMLTARAGLDDRIEGLERGVDLYLTKPFSAKELRAQVRNLIARREELRKRYSTATIIKPSEIAATSIDKAFLERVIKCIEAHFEDEKFGVEELARDASMSISQLNRKLNALVGQPSGELIRSLRLQRAADLLKQNAGSVAEISYRLGFSDQAHFSRAFKKQFGQTPSAYRKP